MAASVRREAARIRTVLGDRALRLEHTGSTAVPGLATKPVIDIVLGVNDSSDESTYVPVLEAAGHVLRIRETQWYQHGLFQRSGYRHQLARFSAGCPEIDRMILFRYWLRSHEADRTLPAGADPGVGRPAERKAPHLQMRGSLT